MDKCIKHEYKTGIALGHLMTNGVTTNPKYIKRGEAIYPSKKVKLVYVSKCLHCGKSNV